MALPFNGRRRAIQILRQARGVVYATPVYKPERDRTMIEEILNINQK